MPASGWGVKRFPDLGSLTQRPIRAAAPWLGIGKRVRNWKKVIHNYASIHFFSQP
jgi:hypothetical protein